MNSTITLDRIKLSEEGRMVSYHYTIPSQLRKYFTNHSLYVKFEEDVSDVPYSILVIPFLANFVPISWFAGFAIEVEEADGVFLDSLERIRTEFLKDFDDIRHHTVLTKREANTRLSNDTGDTKAAMLFSGGVDAYATFFRHFEENPELITILGADMKVDDSEQWSNLLRYYDSEQPIQDNRKIFVESNMRDFYNFEVDKLLPEPGWWGYIQHGLSLTTTIAPLSYLHGFQKLYIASSRCEDFDVRPWGSTPHTDNLIEWSGCKVYHDSFDWSRFAKVRHIASYSHQYGVKPRLRVCYNEFKSGLNCGVCEKCCRTIFALILHGEDPNEYGFSDIDSTIYQTIKYSINGGYHTEGTRFFWGEMKDLSLADGAFIFDKGNESVERELIRDTLRYIQENDSKPLQQSSERDKRKQLFISKHPKITKFYLKLRHLFS